MHILWGNTTSTSNKKFLKQLNTTLLSRIQQCLQTKIENYDVSPFSQKSIYMYYCIPSLEEKNTLSTKSDSFHYLLALVV